MKPPDLSRGIITHAELTALPFHASWVDGRTGCLFARFDARIVPESDSRNLRAEITWGDDADNLGPGAADEHVRYFAPELWLETNARRNDGSLETYDGIKVDLTTDEAAAIVAADPALLLERYKTEIDGLLIPEVTDGGTGD
jgi:hypothetical protein